MGLTRQANTQSLGSKLSFVQFGMKSIYNISILENILQDPKQKKSRKITLMQNNWRNLSEVIGNFFVLARLVYNEFNEMTLETLDNDIVDSLEGCKV